MSVFASFGISGSALTAQRLRMDVLAGNVANSETTRTPDGGPYRRADVVFAPIMAPQRLGSTKRPESPTTGVAVSQIIADAGEPKQVYDPGHPDADASGYVAYPNIDVVTEMTNLLSAVRSYEANVTVLNITKATAQRALEIGRA